MENETRLDASTNRFCQRNLKDGSDKESGHCSKIGKDIRLQEQLEKPETIEIGEDRCFRTGTSIL